MELTASSLPAHSVVGAPLTTRSWTDEATLSRQPESNGDSSLMVTHPIGVEMRFAAAILLFAMLGCRGLEPKPLVAVEGTWVLESLNGAPLPATMPGGAELLGSTFLAGDGLFTRTSTIRTATSQSPSQVVQTGGYYCGRVECGPRSGLLVFRESGIEAQATIAGTSLTISEPDLVWVYRRN